MSDEETILNDDILPNLPTRLRLMRLGLGWSQEDLAQHSGVGVKSISSFETGSRIFALKLLHLIELATACGYDLCQLLSDPIESFGPSAAVLKEIERRERDDRSRFPEVRITSRAPKNRNRQSVKRGVQTQVPSSSNLGSPLGWRV